MFLLKKLIEKGELRLKNYIFFLQNLNHYFFHRFFLLLYN
jgi:hypothetical protein